MNEIISEFESKHIPQALALWQETEGVGLSSSDEPRPLTQFLSRNPHLSFVALQSKNVVGTVLCGHDGRHALIHHLVVSADHRRKGIGRELLRKGLAALSDTGIEKCHLLVFKSNAAGLAFWRAVGAEERTSIALFSLSTETDA